MLLKSKYGKPQMSRYYFKVLIAAILAPFFLFVIIACLRLFSMGPIFEKS